MNMKSALILMFLTVLATTSNINQTKLTPLQSKHIFNLFKEQKLGLIFDYQQDLYTSGTLFRLKHGNDIVFSLSTDKDESTTKFIIQIGSDLFQTDSIELINSDDDFHRLNLQLANGRFQLILDCVKIANGEYEFKDVESSHKKSSVEVGFGVSSDSSFPGQIREFSADISDVANLHCSELRVSSHLRVYRSSLPLQSVQEDAELNQKVMSSSPVQMPCATSLVTTELRGCLDRIKAFEKLSRDLNLDVPPNFDVKKAFNDILKGPLKYSNKYTIGIRVFELLGIISKQYWFKVKGLVVKKLRNNHSRQSTFQFICASTELDPLSDETIDEWFQLYHERRLETVPTATRDYQKLIQMIDANFFRINKVIFKNFHFNIHGMFDSNLRYGCKSLRGISKKSELMLVDLLHGKSKKCVIAHHSLYELFGESIEFVEIYSNRVFGYLNKYSRSTYLLLFELDLSNLICKLISHKKLDFDGNQIIMDQRDNRKFALLSGHGRQIAMVGDVNNDEIHIEDYKLEFGLNHCCPKLADDIFYGIRIRGQGNRTSFQHWQLDSGVTTVSSDKFMFQRGENIDPSRFKFCQYAWVAKSHCYVNTQDGLVVFDVEAQKSTKINFALPNIRYVMGIAMDEDENLIVKESDYFYSLPTRKPEKLEKLAWYDLKRRALDQKKKYHEKTLASLPVKYRPFHGVE